MKANSAKALLFWGLVFALGVLLAWQVNGFIAIESGPKALPDESPPEVRPAAAAPAPLPAFAAIVVPGGASQDMRYQRATAALAQALSRRTGSRPPIVEATGRLPDGRLIFVGVQPADGAFTSTGEPQASGAFLLQATGGEGRPAVIVDGADELGDVYGAYELARRLQAGLSEEELAALDVTIAPRLPYRFVDLGAVGITPDPPAWQVDDYSHHSRAFQDVILPDPPFIDPAAMAQVERDFQEYVQRMIAYGYNGLIVDGFLEYVNFDNVGDGTAVYPAASVYRQRHQALRQAFGRLFQYADDMGLTVILKTDMLALSPPLRNYLEDNLGGIDTHDPALWQVYGRGLAELFETFPAVDGLMIRIGEAGAVYNLPGWDYTSELYVRDVAAVQQMLRTFGDVAAEYGRTLFFRTWSVGVGEVGDMHTNPESYERLLADLDLPNLVVSTKYTMGDYYSYLPLNPTLASGRQRRIVEFQARREFEAFNAFPNDLGALHQTALQTLGRQNPQIEGVWVWTQGGGPLRAGPMSLYPFHGFWQLIDDNVYITGQLAWNPDADLNDLTESWVRINLSDDPHSVEKLVQVLSLSRSAVLEGLYIEPFARQQVLALGLEPPPMMWIFEWDIVSGSNSALTAVSMVIQDEIDQAVAGGFDALDTVREMQALVEAIDPATFYEPALHGKLLDSLAYEESLFETLAWYRTAFLNYYHWLASGDRQAYRDWQAAYDRFRELEQVHLATYGADLDFPAYNFFAVDAGMSHLERGQVMAWLARGLLLLMALTVLAGSRFVQRRTPPFPGKSGLRALWLALVSPWRLSEFQAESQQVQQRLSSVDRLVVSLWPLLLVGAGRLVFSSFHSSTYALLVILSLAPFILILLALYRPRFLLWAAISGPLMLKTAVLLGPVAVRGPVYYWYLFWTNSPFRTLFIALSAAAAGWLAYVIYTTARTVYGRRAPAALGHLLLAIGLPFLLIGATIQWVGLDSALTAYNDQMAILPLGLSRILGITTHLGIPSELPLVIASLGLALLVIGGLASWLGSRPTRPPQEGVQAA